MTSIALKSVATSTPIAGPSSLDASIWAAPPANDLAPTLHPTKVLHRVARAIQERRVCLIHYAAVPGAAPTIRLVEPLAIVSTRGAMGLLAWCRMRRDLRTFRVDRVISIAVETERYAAFPDIAFERFIRVRRRALL